ncbi:MAG: hypothetical protein RIG84_13195 [Roseovarius sp.]
MSAQGRKRRAQVVCALLLHIPIVAIAAYAVAKGIGLYVDLLAVGLVATVTATVLTVPYIGRIVA